jgi:hypothetical protein
MISGSSGIFRDLRLVLRTLHEALLDQAEEVEKELQMIAL